jgi:hypothetical protein
MQSVFVAYFDILGFKQIVENLSGEELLSVLNQFTLMSQKSISEGKVRQREDRCFVYDIRRANIRCLHISDSVIFWSKSNTKEDFVDMAKICQDFLLSTLHTSIPVRGCMTYGELFYKSGEVNNSYYSYLLLGKGLVSAYIGAESLEFVGCVIDNSIKDVVSVENLEMADELFYQIADIPHKPDVDLNSELIIKIKPVMNEGSFENMKECLKNSFVFHQKIAFDRLSDSIKRKYDNTLELWRKIYKIGK